MEIWLRIARLCSLLIATVGVVGAFFALVWWEPLQFVGALVILGVAVAWWRGFSFWMRVRSHGSGS